jgi:glucose-6-phosphate 1-dehydrogenase
MSDFHSNSQPSPHGDTTSGSRPSIIVLGASGDLARKKIFPALFSLYCQKLLPEEFQVYGFARSSMADGEFRSRITEHLTCRYTPDHSCAERMEEFLARCSYVSGEYDSEKSFEALEGRIRDLQGPTTNRVFYMAVPPFLFLSVSEALTRVGLVQRSGARPWSRVVIEKPFGTDRASSDQLVSELAKVFDEEQTYRIDHYLGKEVIQNLLVLRFANLIFDPIWNRSHIENVQISWMEDIGLAGRGGYFDRYGIIRDVMQNHLLQILALVSMEQPTSLAARDVGDEKVKALRCVLPAKLEDVVLGQYSAGTGRNGTREAGYTEDEGVPEDSRTPTFAAVVLRIRNRRWDGVPFLLRAGKGLNRSTTEIRIRFREVPGNIYRECRTGLEPNELVIRVQPDESISFRITNKVPGLSMDLTRSDLDLRYHTAFESLIPDAYECLLLDVIEGDRSLFIRADELAAAWDVFTPLLHEIDDREIRPADYAFGTTGPEESFALAEKWGVSWKS